MITGSQVGVGKMDFFPRLKAGSIDLKMKVIDYRTLRTIVFLGDFSLENFKISDVVD
jgi:hypothetical protein